MGGKWTVYSLLGNRQGAEEDQDEPRALKGIFPREGGPERKTRQSRETL